MPTLVTQHPVKNHDVWPLHFDKHENEHAEVDIASPRVYRKSDDPNDLVLLFDPADEVRAKEFGPSARPAQHYGSSWRGDVYLLRKAVA